MKQAKSSSLQYRLRPSTVDDAQGLARVEIECHPGIYTNNEQTLNRLESVFKERIVLLKDWIRLLEVNGVVKGMIISCPIQEDLDSLINNDMTENVNIKKLFNTRGNCLYIVNLAIIRTGMPQASRLLMRDLRTQALRNGIKSVYFTSRIPGLKSWIAETGQVMPENDNELDKLANRYVDLRSKDSKGKSAPIDSLLRLYHRIGARKVVLVRSAWPEDLPSLGYGVVFVIKNPLYRFKLLARLLVRF